MLPCLSPWFSQLELASASLSLVANTVLGILVLFRTPCEMKIYRRVLLCNCAVDILFTVAAYAIELVSQRPARSSDWVESTAPHVLALWVKGVSECPFYSTSEKRLFCVVINKQGYGLKTDPGPPSTDSGLVQYAVKARGNVHTSGGST